MYQVVGEYSGNYGFIVSSHLINVNAYSLKPTFLKRMHARTECPTRQV
jgi:hypothetical protein